MTSFLNAALRQRLSSSTRLLLVLSAVALLAACAAPLSTTVTTFNRWPADTAGSSFGFLAPAAPVPELEQASYESVVQAALEKQGLTRAPAGQPARILVDMQLSAGSDVRTWLRPVYQDTYVYLPPYRDAWGRLYGGGWALSPFGPQYVGSEPVSQVVRIANLRLRLLDTKPEPGSATNPVTDQPRTVFESTAAYEGAQGDLPVLVPYLVRSVFDEFPGQNGRVRTVSFDRKTGELIKK